MPNPHATHPLLQLKALGQSVWLDDIRRSWLRDGSLARMILGDGLHGVTSNPAIFEKALSAGDGYGTAIHALAARGLDSAALCEMLVLDDVAAAADQLRTVYERSAGGDGFVSIEVSPYLADDSDGTIAEARRLWTTLERPNIMIKVPATRAGLPAIRQLIAEGINVNVTLLFGVARYREVADAWLGALEDRRAASLPLAPVASVASFFLSRIDSWVDRRLDAVGNDAARALRGRAAIASAQLAYEAFTEICAGARWQALALHDARPQRLLWASTSTKDPTYPDLKYVEPLIAAETVTTLPLETLRAYRDHGRPALRIGQGLELAREIPKRLAALGIELDEVCAQLEREGIRKFVEPLTRMHGTVQKQLEAFKAKGA